MAGNPLKSERTQRVVAGVAIVFVVLIIVTFGIAQSNDNPQTVFLAALSNSMNATALTIHDTETASGTTEDILTQLNFGQHPTSETLTTLKSDGATAQTETLTTPTAAYTRYVSIYKVVKDGQL
jgi:hypothetical protein